MLSGNLLKDSRCRCPFRDPGLVPAAGLVALWGCPGGDSLRFRRLFYAHHSHWNIDERITGRRPLFCRGRRVRVRLVLHRSGVGVTNGNAQADIVLGRLQKGLRRHPIIRKPGFFCKLTLDELSRCASDLALSARALKNMVPGITLLLWRTEFAPPSMSMGSHEPIH